MQKRFLFLASVLAIGPAAAIVYLDLPRWWILLGLWLACAPILLGLVRSGHQSERPHSEKRTGPMS